MTRIVVEFDDEIHVLCEGDVLKIQIHRSPITISPMSDKDSEKFKECSQCEEPLHRVGSEWKCTNPDCEEDKNWEEWHKYQDEKRKLK